MRRVEDFYGSACETKRRIQSLVHDKSRALVLRKAVTEMCSGLKKGEEAGMLLNRLEKLLESEYESEWFAFDWQKDQQVKDDTACFKRFLDWLGDAQCAEANLRTTVTEPDLSSRADLIVRWPDGGICAMIIHFKKADKSPGGKSPETSTKKDLYMLVSKVALEEAYPGIQTALVYLANDSNGAGAIGKFAVLQTRKSNVFIENWKNLYEDGFFMREYALSLISELASHKPAPDCFNCSQRDLCTKETASKMQRQLPASLAERDDTYQMPEFTKAQQKVVDFKDGPMLVCAGPGSGKTATLVGRIQKLISTGVEPELILGITFTREAAGELLRRCQSFCKADEHPEILTLNALGYKLLRDNEEIAGRKVNLLAQLDRYRLIKNLLSDAPKMAGFSYSVLNGKMGLIATLDRRIEEYRANPDAYRQKHPETDLSFARFVRQYEAAIKEGGFIGYDEQITLAIKLMEDHPDIAESLSRRYSYIMIDEYQDVNAEQVQFIYALAKHRNLVAVGDDDQSIYAFRGGSNRYMLSFCRDFKDAERVVLEENFRSTEALVASSQDFIAGNRNRIEKTVQAVRKKGCEPEVLKGRNAQNINRCVEQLLADGYAYKDIAVLASKNATLEDLSREVSFKSVLGKAYLRESAMFRIILNILSLSYTGHSDRTLLTLMTLMDVPVPEEGTDISSMLKNPKDAAMTRAANIINTALSRVSGGCSSVYLTDYLCQTFGMEGTAIEEALYGVIEKNHLMSCKALFSHMQNMVDFEDETRIEPDCSEAVIFLTSHESKGMEWRAVIMCDDYKDDRSEETNRLYYVAMTRAKDMLYILTEGDTLLNKKKGGKAA